MNLKSGCLICTIGLIATFGVSYLVTAGLLYLIMWGLTALGVVLPIAWSWGLSAVVWLILFLVKSSFNVALKK